MSISFNINKSGIKAQQLALDAISHNIANVSTDGYKAKQVRFQSLVNNEITEADVLLNGAVGSIPAGAIGEVAITDNRQGAMVAREDGSDVGYSEMSNVDLAQELSSMIVAQRAYELNIKMTQSTDEIMSIINQFGV